MKQCRSYIIKYLHTPTKLISKRYWQCFLFAKTLFPGLFLPLQILHKFEYFGQIYIQLQFCMINSKQNIIHFIIFKIIFQAFHKLEERKKYLNYLTIFFEILLDFFSSVNKKIGKGTEF